ncbi:NAD(P)-dependent oxidoreductase [Chryseobacterium phosphatilyticum]|uniref:NAD(P)-dependent oxidoreductase n=1 Tax=Chryseobacterium phosphatilyticum TaxID=475075 RepID=A0A316X3K9_9FLAO|nr:NAD(P)-dependent oxidoreductase [Chryseobacterium phosphatilyticum]PWN68331.1 NAD(P)-dependent oxidoreductase [Chryseobacterium phosphatilyticum]
MIIGNGLIANSLTGIDSKDYVFFASGVSNSLETKDSEFEREFSLLKTTYEQHREKKIIYFSTLSIHDQSKQNSPYVIYKKNIEEYIKNNIDHYLILRIGNIVGNGGNPNTLFNFLKNQIAHSNQFTVHTKARRLLLDIEDISKFLESYCLHLPNKVINFSFPYNFDLKEIIGAIENETHQKACYSEVNEGDFYKVDFEKEIHAFFSGMSPEKYLETLTRKYI